MLRKKNIDEQENNDTNKINAFQDEDMISKGSFSNFQIGEETKNHLKEVGIEYLFPIQQATFQAIYDGKDIIGQDRTGSGKTLAFTLPILENFRKNNTFKNNKRYPLMAVIVPTRELATQVSKEMERFMNFQDEYRIGCFYGGNQDVWMNIKQLGRGIDVLVGTPGRLLDLQKRGELFLGNLKVLCLDETDQMLNQGFEKDIEAILDLAKEDLGKEGRTYEEVQYLLFSATIPPWVKDMSRKLMKKNYSHVNMIQHGSNQTPSQVKHLKILFQNKQQKIAAIGDIVNVYGGSHGRTIIFTNKKQDANDVHLHGNLKMDSQILHGDIQQKLRDVVFRSFREGKLKCLVATNVAARGLDLPKIDLIIQLSPPESAEFYIHRSGRTGRAGQQGTCITLYTDREEQIVSRIENIGKFKMSKIGVPQIGDIIKANTRDLNKAFEEVNKDVFPYFKSTAQEILAQHDPEDAMCRALAIVTGYTQTIQQRSLLCSAENYVTYMITGTREVRTKGYMWGLLKRYFDDNLVQQFRGLKLLKDYSGAVFDLPVKQQQIFEGEGEEMKRQGFSITTPQQLPEMEQKQYNDFKKFDNRGNNRYNNNDRGNNRYNNNDRGNNRYNNNDRGNNRFNNDRGNNDRYNKYSNGKQDNGNSERDLKKIYIAGLNYSSQVKDLRKLFEENGHRPYDVYIVEDQSGRSKGFGYVKFGDEQQADKAMQSMNHTKLDGKNLNMEFAINRRTNNQQIIFNYKSKIFFQIFYSNFLLFLNKQIMKEIKKYTSKDKQYSFIQKPTQN